MNQYGWLDRYLLEKPGVRKDFKEEWQWWRYQVGGKLFAAILCPGPQYQKEYAGKDLLTLKCDPMYAELLRKEHPEILPGFYTDKRCWNSIDLGRTLPDGLVRKLCDDSYQLVFEKLTKKRQREILEGIEECWDGAAGRGLPDGGFRRAAAGRKGICGGWADSGICMTRTARGEKTAAEVGRIRAEGRTCRSLPAEDGDRADGAGPD